MGDLRSFFFIVALASGESELNSTSDYLWFNLLVGDYFLCCDCFWVVIGLADSVALWGVGSISDTASVIALTSC